MPKAPLPAPERDTPAQFAARANVSVRTVYRAIAAGQITVDYIGNVPRIDPAKNMARIGRAHSPSGPQRGRPKKAAQ